MKPLHFVLFFFVLFAVTACMTTKKTMSTCSLDEKNFAERKTLFAGLMKSATAKEPIPQGYAVTFPTPKEVGTITRIIELEQSCCPFLSFKIDVPAGVPMRLEITGPADARSLIKELVLHP